MALGVAADAPVQGGRADQGAVPLASPGAAVQYQSWARIRQPSALPVRAHNHPAFAGIPSRVYGPGPGFFPDQTLSSPIRSRATPTCGCTR